jgi:hypothetical protein
MGSQSSGYRPRRNWLLQRARPAPATAKDEIRVAATRHDGAGAPIDVTPREPRRARADARAGQGRFVPRSPRRRARDNCRVPALRADRPGIARSTPFLCNGWTRRPWSSRRVSCWCADAGGDAACGMKLSVPRSNGASIACNRVRRIRKGGCSSVWPSMRSPALWSTEKHRCLSLSARLWWRATHRRVARVRRCHPPARTYS